MLFLQRNFNRTEHDDFVLNVQHQISAYDEALPVYDSTGSVVG